jgi:ankyrin repeat protein
MKNYFKMTQKILNKNLWKWLLIVALRVINKNEKNSSIIAYRNGMNEVVQRLLVAKADVNTKKNDGWTALHLGMHR